MLLLLSHLNPGHVHREAVLGHLFSESSSAGDHCLRRLRREALVGPCLDFGFLQPGWGWVLRDVSCRTPPAQCRGWSGPSDHSMAAKDTFQELRLGGFQRISCYFPSRLADPSPARKLEVIKIKITTQHRTASLFCCFFAFP